MRPKSSTPETPSERLVRDIRRATRKQYSAEEKIRIVLDGLRGEVTIAELCRREGIADYVASEVVPAPVNDEPPDLCLRSPVAFGLLTGGTRGTRQPRAENRIPIPGS